MHCPALPRPVLPCPALHCTALRCAARGGAGRGGYCPTHYALHCTALHCTARGRAGRVLPYCTALHCTARGGGGAGLVLFQLALEEVHPKDLQVDVAHRHVTVAGVVLPTKQSGKCFRVGIFLDFAGSSTRTSHGAYVQMGGRNRIDPHREYN